MYLNDGGAKINQNDFFIKSRMPEKVCDTCNDSSKDVAEFNKSGTGAYYSNCKACFLDVPRSLYAKDAHGIRYKNCRTCYSENTAREYIERRDAKAKAGTTGGAKLYNRPATYKKAPTAAKNDGVYLWI